MKRLFSCIYIVLSSFTFVVKAQPEKNLTDAFEQATKYYNIGDYKSAIEQYQKILNAGYESSSLYYNLGNAHYKLNDVPESIYFYEKALKLNPEDEDTLNNLAFAQQMTVDVITPLTQTWFKRISDRITSLFTINTWQLFPIVSVFLFVLFFLLYYFLEKSLLKRLFFSAMCIALVIGIGTYFITDFHKKNIDTRSFAILFDKTVSVYAEPSSHSSESFVLHQGTKVEVQENIDEWVKIRLADGKIGWIKRSSIRII